MINPIVKHEIEIAGLEIKIGDSWYEIINIAYFKGFWIVHWLDTRITIYNSRPLIVPTVLSDSHQIREISHPALTLLNEISESLAPRLIKGLVPIDFSDAEKHCLLRALDRGWATTCPSAGVFDNTLNSLMARGILERIPNHAKITLTQTGFTIAADLRYRASWKEANK